MDPISFPADLTDLPDEDLTSFVEQIQERANALADVDTDEAVEELETLAEHLDRITATQTKRTEDAAKRRERAENAKARLAPKDKADDTDETDEVDPPAAEDDTDDDDDDEDEDTVADTADEGVLVAAGQRAGLKGRRPSHNKPRPTNRRPEHSFSMRATPHAQMPEGTEFTTPLDVARAITAKRLSMRHIPSSVADEFVSIAAGVRTGMVDVLGSDAEQNYEILRRVQAGANEAQALVASGSGLPPFSPMYDFFRTAVPQNPVERGLQAVQAPRGGIRYIVSPNVSQAANAIDVSTTARDYTAAPGVNAGPKSKVKVTVPGVAESTVSAVSQRVVFDNLQYRVFPELVQSFMQDVAVQFTTRKETFYLDFLDSVATAVTADTAYGASRGLLYDLTLAAVGYRKRNGMARNATLEYFAQDWELDVFKADMAMDAADGTQWFEVTDAKVEAAFRERGIRPIWTNNSSTALVSTQGMLAAQAAGALRAWPLNISGYLEAPGTTIRLDGGSLDVGMVRDSVYNGTNDLELFSEEWIGAAKLGFEVVRLTSRFRISGAAPAGVTALT